MELQVLSNGNKDETKPQFQCQQKEQQEFGTPQQEQKREKTATVTNSFLIFTWDHPSDKEPP